MTQEKQRKNAVIAIVIFAVAAIVAVVLLGPTLENDFNQSAQQDPDRTSINPRLPSTLSDYVAQLRSKLPEGTRIETEEGTRRSSDTVYVILPQDTSVELGKQTAAAIERQVLAQYEYDRTATQLVQVKNGVALQAQPIGPFQEPIDFAEQWEKLHHISPAFTGHYDEARHLPTQLFATDIAEYASERECADKLDTDPAAFSDPALTKLIDDDLELYFGYTDCGKYRVFVHAILGDQNPKIEALAELMRTELPLRDNTLIKIGFNGDLHIADPKLSEEDRATIQKSWDLGTIKIEEE